jgi:oligoendopeptidase F
MRRLIVILASLLCLQGAIAWAQGYAELEQERTKLSHQEQELRREAFRARLTHNDKKAKDLQKKIQTVHKQHIEVLRGLGELPR